MVEILDNPELRQRVAPITVERYHRMIDAGLFDDWKVELLNGVLVEKMSKSPLHVFLVDLLIAQLRTHCPETQYWVRKEDPLSIGLSEPEPDVSVVSGSRADFKRSNPATAQLIIEVAVSSLAIDRAKSEIYAKAGVPECWIVCPEERQTEVFRNSVRGTYAERQTIPASELLASSALPGFAFHLAAALDE